MRVTMWAVVLIAADVTVRTSMSGLALSPERGRPSLRCEDSRGRPRSGRCCRPTARSWRRWHGNGVFVLPLL
jgi:hypothetical protein